jgi:hypothetical protein
MAWRSMIPNQISTRFIHDAEVGVKCTWTRGLAVSQSRISTPFVRGVVVHHQVQLALGVGAGNLAKESEELLLEVPRLAGRGDLAGGDVQRGEQGGGAMTDIVVGAPLGHAGLHRQHGCGPV